MLVNQAVPLTLDLHQIGSAHHFRAFVPLALVRLVFGRLILLILKPPHVLRHAVAQTHLEPSAEPSGSLLSVFRQLLWPTHVLAPLLALRPLGALLIQRLTHHLFAHHELAERCQLAPRPS